MNDPGFLASPQFLLAFGTVCTLVGVFLKPIAQKWIMNGKSAVPNADIQRLEDGMEKGFVALGTRFDESEKRHREDVIRIHKRIDDLPQQYVSRGEFEQCQKGHERD